MRGGWVNEKSEPPPLPTLLGPSSRSLPPSLCPSVPRSLSGAPAGLCGASLLQLLDECCGGEQENGIRTTPITNTSDQHHPIILSHPLLTPPSHNISITLISNIDLITLINIITLITDQHTLCNSTSTEWTDVLCGCSLVKNPRGQRLTSDNLLFYFLQLLANFLQQLLQTKKKRIFHRWLDFQVR